MFKLDREGLIKLVKDMDEVVASHISDPEVLQRIRIEWLKINVKT